MADEKVTADDETFDEPVGLSRQVVALSRLREFISNGKSTFAPHFYVDIEIALAALAASLSTQRATEMRASVIAGGEVPESLLYDLAGIAMTHLHFGPTIASAIGVLNLFGPLQAQLAETKAEAEREINAALKLAGDYVVRSREGGGPENIYGSLALTMGQLKTMVDNLIRDEIRDKSFLVNNNLKAHTPYALCCWCDFSQPCESDEECTRIAKDHSANCAANPLRSQLTALQAKLEAALSVLRI